MLTLVLGVTLAGCHGPAQRYRNSAPYLERHIRASDDTNFTVMFKATVLVPSRDILLLDPLWRTLCGGEAWNAMGDGVDDSSFCTNRAPDELTPQRVALGACIELPPQPPVRVLKIKRSATGPGFLGEDASGRKFLFKLDHPDSPELSTSATIIASRLLWALGYNVSAEYLVRIEGTGDERFDGHRATASLLVPNVRGHFHFDWFRHRRELRGLRLAAAWIHDVDRVGSNTLVTVADGRARYYLIDFNSCLGAWQGRPKEPWRGWRPQWSVGWTLLRVCSLGLLHPEPNSRQPVVSPAIGRFDAVSFDPLAWCPQVPNNAFEHMTRADQRWMARKIAALRREHIEAIVAAAEFSDPQDAATMIDTLLARQQKIRALGDEWP